VTPVYAERRIHVGSGSKADLDVRESDVSAVTPTPEAELDVLRAPSGLPR